MPETTVARWYFGGLAGSGAACFTHPLDLLKVHLQTQEKGKMSLVRMTAHIVKSDGFLAMYNGLSASILRQMTYSLVRFGIYETVKNNMVDPNKPMPFHMKILLAAVSGAAGGYVGTPGDMINVRMQNDIKLSAAERRNYKHALDGVIQVYRKEGFKNLFSGATMATSRAVLMTIGQLSIYDQMKQVLLQTPYFEDNFLTHLTASLTAGAMATTLTQPMDVMKTRMMSAKPGEYSGITQCALEIAKSGPLGFFKGFIPAFVRLGPHTVLTFLLFEQLRQNFGIVKVY